MSTFEPGRYKAEQRRGWSSAAVGWNRWWETFERAAQSVSDRLLELAEVQPGHRVLDVATGIGEPAITAARRVGPTGRVLGIDQAPRMVAVARRRMASLGLTNLEFQEMDAEAPALAEGSFDAVLCRWGLMFLPDLDGALPRLGRLLVPGGRLAAAVWGDASQVPLIGLATATFREVLNATPPPGAPTPFDLADQDALRSRLERAGLADVRSEPLSVMFEFASPEAYARFTREIAPPLPTLDELPPERQEEVWRTLAAAALPYVSRDGRLRLSNTALCVVGRKLGSGLALAADATKPTCPFCGGRDTRLESVFGSTLGFAQHWCETCRTVFEYLKWDEP